MLRDRLAIRSKLGNALERTARWLLTALCMSGLIGIHAAPSFADTQGPVAQPPPPHVEVERSLAAILQEKQQLLDNVRSDDLERLRAQLAQIREELRQSRLQMDRALLVGAWSGKSVKKKAAHIIETMQEAEIVSLMGVAVASGYEYPTKKVPPAVAHSTGRLFSLLEDLQTEVTALNRELNK